MRTGTGLASSLCIALSVTPATAGAAGEPAGEGVQAILPFAAGRAHLLLQGNNGPYGHSGHVAYAFDFKMPIGTEVVAARGGTVMAVEQRYEDGNRKPGQENVVVLRHEDGTYGRYYHLTRNGSLVAVGASIRQGEAIARSGNTGASAGPHLHFDVTRGCYEWGCQTVPVVFQNAGAEYLVAGRTYTAMEWPDPGSPVEIKVTQKYLVPVCLNGQAVNADQRGWRLAPGRHSLAFTMRNSPRPGVTGAGGEPGTALVRFVLEAGHRYEVESRAAATAFSLRVWKLGEWKPVVRDRTVDRIVSEEPEWATSVCDVVTGR